MNTGHVLQVEKETTRWPSLFSVYGILNFGVWWVLVQKKLCGIPCGRCQNQFSHVHKLLVEAPVAYSNFAKFVFAESCCLLAPPEPRPRDLVSRNLRLKKLKTWKCDRCGTNDIVCIRCSSQILCFELFVIRLSLHSAAVQTNRSVGISVFVTRYCTCEVEIFHRGVFRSFPGSSFTGTVVSY